MFVEIDNSPRDYAWGSVHAIAELLGRSASGKPEAELWLGAHPGSPSRILHPEVTGGAMDVASWIAADRVTALGDLSSLPFLLKVLAAETALSIQAHPSMEQARAGFERDNAAGIPVDAPNRNYRDASHKPELIFCVSESFHALCGMRAVPDSIAVIRAFVTEGAARGLPTEELQRLVTLLGEDRETVRGVVALLLEPHSTRARAIVNELGAIATSVAPASPIERDASTVRLLSAEYPNDPGIAVALLMNRVDLRRGEALYVPHGILHAYLSGLGIEIMAASDNVLRGGLTTKHIDVAELLDVGVFVPTRPEILPPEHIAPGVDRYAPGVPEFELIHVRVSDANPVAEFRIDGPSIALCTAGHARVTGQHSGADVRRGNAVFITPDEQTVRVEGAAEMFFARPGR